MAIPNRNINYPTAIKYGAGRIKELAEFCKANGIKRPLVVTDKGLAAMPMVAEIMADLKAAGLKAALFADVRPTRWRRTCSPAARPSRTASMTASSRSAAAPASTPAR